MSGLALSIIFLVGSHAADTTSNWRGPEANPLLAQQGTFSAQSAGLKMGLVGAVALAELVVTRKRPRLRRWVELFNYADGATTSVIAVRNWRTK